MDDNEDPSSLLQVNAGTYQQKRRPRGAGPWNLKSVFKDEPPGTYLELLKPLAYINYLAYITSGDDVWHANVWQDKYHANKTSLGLLSAGNKWGLAHELERNGPPDGQSPHMRALVDHTKKRAILAFRGACMDKSKGDCRHDLCVLGNALNTWNGCPRFPELLAKHHDYVKLAFADVKRARARLGPDYALMVTGHSLGGMLALTIDAVDGAEKLDFQVVALEPAPYGNVLRNNQGLSNDELWMWDTRRRYAVYDPWDLSSSSPAPLEVLRPSTTVCVYENVPLPQACQDCVATTMGSNPFLSDSQALGQCYQRPPDPVLKYPKCKDAVHFLNHYVKDLFSLKTSDGRTVLPKCRTVNPQ